MPRANAEYGDAVVIGMPNQISMPNRTWWWPGAGETVIQEAVSLCGKFRGAYNTMPIPPDEVRNSSRTGKISLISRLSRAWRATNPPQINLLELNPLRFASDDMTMPRANAEYGDAVLIGMPNRISMPNRT